jgi:hypothetical protein
MTARQTLWAAVREIVVATVTCAVMAWILVEVWTP